MSELKSIWKELRQRFGDLIEPFESWKNADALREYWRPAKVRGLLLSESHVFTSLDEATRKVTLPSLSYEFVPDGFVKLVYCLGYGENGLLEQPIGGNPGTLQFWKIFFSCLVRVESNADFVPILIGGTPSLETRVENKLKVLENIKVQGVWLLDASLAALYPRPPDSAMYLECLEKSWPYVRKKILDVAPEKIVVVGNTVWERFLGRKVPELGIPVCVQPQPQARLTSEEHLAAFRRYYCFTHYDKTFMENFKNTSLSQKTTNKPERTLLCPSCEWTYNDQSGYYTRGGLSLDQSPIALTLYFRKNASSPKTKVVDFVLLDLHRLLDDEYIRYDSKTPNVRVRIVRGEDGCFYIQQKKGTPRYLLNG